MNAVKKLLCIGLATLMFLSTAAHAEPLTRHSAKVLETIDSGGYTYMHVDENGHKFWVAAPQSTIKTGATIHFSEQMWMHNFTSKTLKRDFDKLMFISAVTIEGEMAAAAPAQAAPLMTLQQPVFNKIASNKISATKSNTLAAKNYTIAEVYAQKDSLKGQNIRVHGTVVKISKNIMGRTWVHIEDGTGAGDDKKLIFRSRTESAEMGAMIYAQGTVDTNIDFGMGYAYSVLVEDSTFSQ